jgi:hypothetical protein
MYCPASNRSKNMTKSNAAAALALVLAMGPAHADEGLAARAVSALGTAIASQGNAALLQIRAELREKLLDSLRPQLPAPAPSAPAEPPAAAPADDRR